MNNRDLYNNLAEKYDLRQQNQSTRLLRQKEEKLINKYSKGLVLDIGCGTGYHLGLSENIVGLDISEKMLKIAKSKNRPLIQASVENLPMISGSFDSIFCFYSTLNFVDFPRAADEISRIVKNGGRVLLSVVSVRDIDKYRSSQVNKVKKFRLEGIPVNMKLFEKGDVIKTFERYGFKLENFNSIFRIQKPRWGNFQKFSLLEKIKLGIEKIFPEKNGRIYLFVFKKIH